MGQTVSVRGNRFDGDERFLPAWILNESEDFIQKFLHAFSGIGQNPEITTYSFCTSGSHYAGEKGIPTIGYGPSQEDLAHTVNEFIEIEQLEKATEGYCALMHTFLDL